MEDNEVSQLKLALSRGLSLFGSSWRGEEEETSNVEVGVMAMFLAMCLGGFAVCNGARVDFFSRTLPMDFSDLSSVPCSLPLDAIVSSLLCRVTATAEPTINSMRVLHS